MTFQRVPLRAALLTLVTGLVLATVAATVWISAATASRSVDDLQRRYFHAASDAIAARVRGYLEPALTTLLDTRAQVLGGRVSPSDGDDLGRYLVARLRVHVQLAWLSFSDDATGRFVGCWRRDDGEIVLNRSDPAVNGGTPVEHWVRVDGTLVPHERPLKGGYDPRTSAWYRTAAAAPGPIWTEPSEFNEGRLGITAALAVRTTEAGRVAGVLTADFFLDSLARRLDEIAIDRDTRIAVLTRAGNVVAASWIEKSPADAGAWLTPSLTAATTSVAELAVGAAPSWSFDERGTTRLAAMTATRTEGGGEWVVLVSVPEDRFLEGVRGNRRLALALGGVVALVAVALGWMLSRRIAAPLHQVSRQLGRVAQFDLSPTPSPSSRVTEIHELIDTADRMTASLRSFGRYVPTSVVRELLSLGGEARLGGRRVELTILFSDVVGFTGISESTEAMALVEHLGDYFSAATEAIQARGGTVDKFLGDGILAFFNAPHDVPGHPAEACLAALDLQRRMAALEPGWRAAGRPVLRCRVGLHTGTALVGNVGTPDRFGYTAMGDAVNLASRLEALNKRYGTRVLVSEDTARAAGPGVETRRLERVAVAGRKGGVLVVELLGRRGEVDPATLAARDAYEAALDAFHGRRFDAAEDGFREAAAARPEDLAPRLLLARVEALRSFPPPADWDGTEVILEK